MRQRLTRLADIPAESAISVAHEGQDEIILLWWQGLLCGYINSCPHTGVGLNWRPDAFFDGTGQWLLCGTHGALFRPENGLCVSGPCIGARLSAVSLVIDEGVVYRVI